jgi:hypothetical protein
LVKIPDVLGRAYPHQSVNGSRYQTNSTAGGVPQMRALSPPCTITNRTGTVLSSFVQINGVYLTNYGVVTTDCSKWYSKQNGGGPYPNNQTFCTDAGNVLAVGTKGGYLKITLDRDWLGRGYCGPGVSPCDNVTLAKEQSGGNISLDVQGFVFWEGPWHWELHPFTAWKLHGSPPPPAPPSVPRNPAATAGNATVALNWQVPASSGTSPVSNYKVYRGTTPAGETPLATVGNVLAYTDTAVTNGKTYYYQVSAVSAAGEGAKSNEVSATPKPRPDFSMGAAPVSLTIKIGSSNTSTITLTSLNGLSGNVTLSASMTCSGLCVVYPTASLSPSTINLPANGKGTSTLTITTTLQTSPGTYTITVTAKIGTITHTVTVTVTVTT